VGPELGDPPYVEPQGEDELLMGDFANAADLELDW